MTTAVHHDEHHVSVSERALMARINRRLRPDQQRLCKTRGPWQAKFDLGEFYILDHRLNLALDTHVDLEELARDLDALALWERLEPDCQLS